MLKDEDLEYELGIPEVGETVTDREGDVGTVVEVRDCHNVIVKYPNGLGFHCLVKSCEMYSPLRRLISKK